MTTALSELFDTYRFPARRKRVGRGIGSSRGRTCCRGGKGQSARSGSGPRNHREGGQRPLHMGLPKRGFSRGRWEVLFDTVNLGQIDMMYENGETVSLETLKDKGFLSGRSKGLKILADGELTKTVTIHANKASASVEAKLGKSKMVLAGRMTE